jgi:hypothetical protein
MGGNFQQLDVVLVHGGQAARPPWALLREDDVCPRSTLRAAAVALEI